MAAVRIGLIGFGEVGYIFSQTLTRAGAEVLVYDILLEEPDKADDIKKRITEAGGKAGTLEEVVKSNNYILSTVTTQMAEKVAQTVVPMLKASQIYVDLNSTSPSVKVQISKIIAPSGADFVEGAILGAVGATGAKTRIFTAGEKGQQIADLLSGLGMNVQFYSVKIGKASTFKMLRSIFSKGVEILLLEMLVAAKRAGMERDLWEDITRFMAAQPFDKIGDNWMRSHAVAHERRYHEMLQVVQTMKELHIAPIMTDRTAAYFKQSLDMGMGRIFSQKPQSFEQVIEFIERNLKS